MLVRAYFFLISSCILWSLNPVANKYALMEIAVLQHTPGSLGVFARGLAENSINLGSLYIIKTDDDGVHIGYSIN